MSEDKQYETNIKAILSSNDIKLKDLDIKYEKINKVLKKDYEAAIASIRAQYSMNNNNPNTNINTNNNSNNNQNTTTPDLVEEQYLIYDNKIKLLNDEIYSLEKSNIINEQKVLALKEENKFLKSKFEEERVLLQEKLIEIQEEEYSNRLISNLEEELLSKKRAMQIQLDSAVRNTNKIVEESNNEIFMLKENNSRLNIKINILNKQVINLTSSNNFMEKKWGLGDWGLGIGDWAQSPIPNPQSPIPNPHIIKYYFVLTCFILYSISIYLIYILNIQYKNEVY